MNDLKNNYTYELYDPRTGMTYIGSRSYQASKCEPENDHQYLSSSKHIPHNIKLRMIKTILGRFQTYKEALEHEIFLHECFEVSSNNKFYNRAKQTSTGFSIAGQKHTEETKRLIGEYSRGNTNMRGKRHTEETKLKLRGPRPHTCGANNPAFGKPSVMKGKTHTDETKEKIREALRKVSKTRKKHPNYRGVLIGTSLIDGSTIEINGLAHIKSVLGEKATTSSCWRCIDGHFNHAYGYRWKKKEINE